MNKEAAKYEDWFEKNHLLYESEQEAIKKVLPEFKNGLEVGVGTGIFSNALGITLGIDPSESMAKLAQKKGINVVKGYAEDLPFFDNNFDLILMVTVDCFLNQVLKSFQENYRVLQEGGHLVIAFLDKATKLGQLYERKKSESETYAKARFHTAKEIHNLLEEAGFIIEQEVQTIFSLKNEKQLIKEGHGEGLFVVIRAKKIG